jgi:hypothetical protein
MNIQTVRDNLKNTISGKEKMLEAMHPNNPFETEYMDEAERAAHYATKEFLKVNIGELRRILQDVEQCISKEYTMGDWYNDLENPHGNRLTKG